MRWIAIAIAMGACVGNQPEKVTLDVTEQRADVALKVDGAMIDGGGAAPRTISVSYDFAVIEDATAHTFLVESFVSGGKVGELMVTPKACNGTETDALTVNADGSITLASDACAP